MPGNFLDAPAYKHVQAIFGLTRQKRSIPVFKPLVGPWWVLAQAFEAGDIILEVQGAEIGDDGKVAFRGQVLWP